MGFVVTFSVALVLIAALLAFKMWEIARGSVVFKKQRRVLDVFLEKAASNAHGHLLTIPKHVSIKRLAHAFAHEVVLFFAKSAKFVDVKAESLAMRISRSARDHAVNKKKEASNFLREVNEHKDGLDTETIKRETRL